MGLTTQAEIIVEANITQAKATGENPNLNNMYITGKDKYPIETDHIVLSRISPFAVNAV